MTLYSAETNFHLLVAKFMEKEVVPYHDQWEKDGQASPKVWLKAGEAGLLCASMPEEYGGSGTDFLFSTIRLEELAKVGPTGPGFHLHSEIVAPYILNYGTEEQKKMASTYGAGRDYHCYRDDRTGCRLRPAGYQDYGQRLNLCFSLYEILADPHNIDTEIRIPSD